MGGPQPRRFGCQWIPDRNRSRDFHRHAPTCGRGGTWGDDIWLGQSKRDMSAHRQTLSNALSQCPVIPVLVMDRVDDAVPLARALLAGGRRVLASTLRTPAALDVIRVLAQEVPDAILAAGTVTTPEQWEATALAGAHFAVSPGLTPRLLDTLAHGAPTALLPGIA